MRDTAELVHRSTMRTRSARHSGERGAVLVIIIVGTVAILAFLTVILNRYNGQAVYYQLETLAERVGTISIDNYQRLGTSSITNVTARMQAAVDALDDASPVPSVLQQWKIVGSDMKPIGTIKLREPSDIPTHGIATVEFGFFGSTYEVRANGGDDLSAFTSTVGVISISGELPGTSAPMPAPLTDRRWVPDATKPGGQDLVGTSSAVINVWSGANFQVKTAVSISCTPGFSSVPPAVKFTIDSAPLSTNNRVTTRPIADFNQPIIDYLCQSASQSSEFNNAASVRFPPPDQSVVTNQLPVFLRLFTLFGSPSSIMLNRYVEMTTARRIGIDNRVPCFPSMVVVRRWCRIGGGCEPGFAATE